MSEFAITTNQLVKTYSGKNAVDHVNMHVPVGSIYGFVGENGSGKTTIMRLLMGLARPNGGDYQLFDVPNNDSRIYAVRNQISAIVEAPSLVPSMSAVDNLKYACMYYGIDGSIERINAVLKQVGLEDTGKKTVRNFSLGMRQRLGIAVLLLNNPKLLLLDEPMNGLDPQGIAELREVIVDLNKQGITILISSHILSELEKVATYWGFISHGRLIQEISAEDLISSCQRHVEIKFEDVKALENALRALKIQSYKMTVEGVKIYDDINITDLLVGLKKNGVDVTSIKTNDVDVENYYLSLTKRGGQDNA